MKPFQRSAEFYPAFYRDKDYGAEAAYVVQTLKDHGWPGGRILELGCGQGGHAFAFAASGYSLLGVDASVGMVDRAWAHHAELPEACQQRLEFQVGDLRRGSWEGPFSSAVALFHVMSYLSTPEDFIEALKNIRLHLAPGGLFAFDFWSGEGVLADPPCVRTRAVPWKNGTLRRTSTPSHHDKNHVIDIRMHFDFPDAPGGTSESAFEETHRMRYLFREDIESACQLTGFSCERFCEWGQAGDAPPTSWNGYCVLRAIPTSFQS